MDNIFWGASTSLKMKLYLHPKCLYINFISAIEKALECDIKHSKAIFFMILFNFLNKFDGQYQNAEDN